MHGQSPRRDEYFMSHFVQQFAMASFLLDVGLSFHIFWWGRLVEEGEEETEFALKRKCSRFHFGTHSQKHSASVKYVGAGARRPSFHTPKFTSEANH